MLAWRRFDLHRFSLCFWARPKPTGNNPKLKFIGWKSGLGLVRCRVKRPDATRFRPLKIFIAG